MGKSNGFNFGTGYNLFSAEDPRPFSTPGYELNFSGKPDLSKVMQNMNPGPEYSIGFKPLGTFDMEGTLNLPAKKPSIMGNFLDSVDPKTGMKTGGWGNLALGGAEMLAGLYFGNKQVDMANKQLAESKRQFGLNFGAQQKTINDKLAWQHKARQGYSSNYDGELTQV